MRLGGMSIKEYSLKFVTLSKYASSLVEKSRDEMNRFVTCVLDDQVVDCRANMVHDNMDLGRLMVHAQQVEERRKKRHTRAGNRSRQVRRILQGRVDMKSRISPGLRKDSSTKGSQLHPKVAMIGILSPDIRETTKWIHLKRGHLVESVANCMEESV